MSGTRVEDAPGWSTVRTLLPTLRGRDVVDLGCGLGAFTAWALEQEVASVLALDLSVAMLDQARGAVTDDRVVFEQSDLEQVTLPFEAYDLAYCARVLEHLDDPDRFFRAVRAGMRPGGLLVLSTVHLPHRPSATILATLEEAGWRLGRVVEPSPSSLLLSAEKPPRGA